MNSKSEPAPADLKLNTVLPWALTFLVLVNLPYLAAWLSTPPDKVFVGTFVNTDDFSTYLSAIRQGADGSWVFHFPFSPEAWQPKLMLVPYLLVGKLMALFGGSSLFWFHSLRVTAVCLTLIIFWYWGRLLFPGKARLQLTTWLFMTFGSGVGWMVAVFGLSQWLGQYLLDLGGPEWSIFMILFHSPHFALGLALEILLFSCVINMTQQKKGARWALLGAFAAVASGLTYVYHIPVTGLVIGLYLLTLAWQQKQIPWRHWFYGGIVLLPLTIMLIYYTVLANQDPYFAEYAQFEHIIPPPPFLAAFIGLGFLGLFTLIGFKSWLTQGKSSLVPIWAGVSLLLLYVPIIQFSGRFALGLMVPFATMAAWAVEETILPWLAQRPFYGRFSKWTATPYASLRRLFIVLVIPSTFIMSLLLVKTAVTTPDFPTYLPQSETAAADWLAAHTDENDLIMAYYPLGNYLPRHISGKVFLGQFDYTTDFEEKLTTVETFWDDDTSVEWRLNLIETWGIDYIYAGQYEHNLFQHRITPPGQIVYDAQGVKIYKVID